MYGANSVYLIENALLVQRTVSVIRRESNYVIVNDGLLTATRGCRSHAGNFQRHAGPTQ
jgi:hypothetical protein